MHISLAINYTEGMNFLRSFRDFKSGQNQIKSVTIICSEGVIFFFEKPTDLKSGQNKIKSLTIKYILRELFF